MKKKNCALVSLFKAAFRLRDCLQGKTPKLAPRGYVYGNFEPRRFIPETHSIHLGKGSAAAKAPIFDLQAWKPEITLRVIPGEQRQVNFDPKPEVDFRRAAVDNLVFHLHSASFAVKKKVLIGIEGNFPVAPKEASAATQ